MRPTNSEVLKRLCDAVLEEAREVARRIDRRVEEVCDDCTHRSGGNPDDNHGDAPHSPFDTVADDSPRAGFP